MFRSVAPAALCVDETGEYIEHIKNKIKSRDQFISWSSHLTIMGELRKMTG